MNMVFYDHFHFTVFINDEVADVAIQTVQVFERLAFVNLSHFLFQIHTNHLPRNFLKVTAPQDEWTKPGTETMCPSSLRTACAVSGATTSSRPAALAALSTIADTMKIVSFCGAGKSTMSPKV